MQSTQFRFGPVVFSTDNDHHPLITSITRLIEVWIIVGIQFGAFFGAAIPAAAGVSELCKRLLGWMDTVEAAIWATGQVFRAAVESWQTLTLKRLQYAPG